MSREIFQKFGLITALVIASIALPTSIISFTQQPDIINNYYTENYYNYYNQTFFGNNVTEVDYSKPLERNDYYNLERYD